MAGIYYITKTSTALSTTNDAMTIICAASRTIRVKWISMVGMATASAANEVLVSRSTGGATGGGAITPTPATTQQAAAGMTVNTTWTTQPTLGVTIDRISVNANGGNSYRWYPPNQEPELRNSEQLSIRSASGTSAVTLVVCVEEL